MFIQASIDSEPHQWPHGFVNGDSSINEQWRWFVGPCFRLCCSVEDTVIDVSDSAYFFHGIQRPSIRHMMMKMKKAMVRIGRIRRTGTSCHSVSYLSYEDATPSTSSTRSFASVWIHCRGNLRRIWNKFSRVGWAISAVWKRFSRRE